MTIGKTLVGIHNKLTIAGLACLAAVSATWAKPVLTGETSHTRDSIYIQGEKVEIFFTITGLEPKKPGPNLLIRICDEYERELWKAEHKTLADVHGADMVRIGYGIPQTKLGFYRVYAELSDGTKLITPWSTQRDGELTYAVVRNPKDRPQALYHLAVCFRKKGMPDMAAEQLDLAREIVTEMGPEKLQILYELGDVYQELGRLDEADKFYKEIFRYDMSYRDIAKKVEAIYAAKRAAAAKA